MPRSVPAPSVVGRPVVLLLAVPVVLLLVATGCVPQKRGPVSEVGPSTSAPPTFPRDGEVTEEMVVDGLVADLTAAPGDLDLWVPPERDARCAARKIVTAVGADRLVELGYRPATPGAAFNSLDLSDTERRTSARLLGECVDVEAAVGSLLSGNNFLPGRAAGCVARGLEADDQLDPFVEAWAFRTAVDPFEGPDGGLAAAVLSYAEVCLADSSFNWSLRPSTTTTTAPTSGAPSTAGPPGGAPASGERS